MDNERTKKNNKQLSMHNIKTYNRLSKYSLRHHRYSKHAKNNMNFLRRFLDAVLEINQFKQTFSKYFLRVCSIFTVL